MAQTGTEDEIAGSDVQWPGQPRTRGTAHGEVLSLHDRIIVLGNLDLLAGHAEQFGFGGPEPD